MKLPVLVSLFILPFVASSQTKRHVQTDQYPPVEKVAKDFKTLLQRPNVDFRPSFKSFKADSVLIEKGFIYTEESEKVPVLIYKPVNSILKSFPVIICLHGTGGSKGDESFINLLYQFSKVGIMAVAIDARYHGERIPGGANKSQQYIEAITSAWKNSSRNKQQHPFYYDTVYDLWRLADI